MTNGEKIRQMTDEELSKFLDSFEFNLKDDVCKEHCEKCKQDNWKICEEKSETDQCGITAIKEWLNKEC